MSEERRQNVHYALSRDDEGEFENAVTLVQNLLMPQEPNPEYQYGITKFIYESTRWTPQAPPIEEVHWVIWGAELTATPVLTAAWYHVSLDVLVGNEQPHPSDWDWGELTRNQVRNVRVTPQLGRGSEND